MTTFVPLLDVPLPIVAAPMAGGPTSVALATAVAGAGGFPFLAAGYKTPEALAGETTAWAGHRVWCEPVRARISLARCTGVPCVRRDLQPDADRIGAATSRTVVVTDADYWSEKLDPPLAYPVPVVSLTFALLDPQMSPRCAKRGRGVLASVTTPGRSAGRSRGRRGRPDRPGHLRLVDTAPPTTPPAPSLPPRHRRAGAAGPRREQAFRSSQTGGIDGPSAVRRLYEAGAEAVAVGTLFLRHPRGGHVADPPGPPTDPNLRRDHHHSRVHRPAPARGLRNGFVNRPRRHGACWLPRRPPPHPRAAANRGQGRRRRPPAPVGRNRVPQRTHRPRRRRGAPAHGRTLRGPTRRNRTPRSSTPPPEPIERCFHGRARLPGLTVEPWSRGGVRGAQVAGSRAVPAGAHRGTGCQSEPPATLGAAAESPASPMVSRAT